MQGYQGLTSVREQGWDYQYEGHVKLLEAENAQGVSGIIEQSIVGDNEMQDC